MNHLSSSSDHLNRSHLSSFQNNPHISPPLILLLDNKNETTSQESGLGPSLRLTSNLSSVYHSTNESLGADNFGNSSHSNISEIITSVMKDDSNWDNWWTWNLISFSNLTSLFASTGMVIGGVLPYIPQYFEIKRTQNSSGFSTYVCLALIAANMLRIIFWFGKRFEIPLLIQSIVMIVAMFFMMEICLRMRRRSHNPSISSTRRGFHASKRVFGRDEQGSTDDADDESDDEEKADDSFNKSHQSSIVIPTETYPPSSVTEGTSSPAILSNNRRYKKKCFTDLRPQDFWQWTDLTSYIECTSAFTVIVGLMMYLLMDTSWFVESLGYASLMTEACLAVPQLLRNHRNRSTVGMSVHMVLGWAAGDLFKTGYFLIKQVPMQFIVCGIIQVTVDLLILAQVSIYSSATAAANAASASAIGTTVIPVTGSMCSINSSGSSSKRRKDQSTTSSPPL